MVLSYLLTCGNVDLLGIEYVNEKCQKTNAMTNTKQRLYISTYKMQ